MRAETDTIARVGGDEFVVLMDTDVQWQTPEVLRQRIVEGMSRGFHVGAISRSVAAPAWRRARYPEDGDSRTNS